MPVSCHQRKAKGMFTTSKGTRYSHMHKQVSAQTGYFLHSGFWIFTRLKNNALGDFFFALCNFFIVMLFFPFPD